MNTKQQVNLLASLIFIFANILHIGGSLQACWTEVQEILLAVHKYFCL